MPAGSDRKGKIVFASESHSGLDVGYRGDGQHGERSRAVESGILGQPLLRVRT